MPDPAADAEVNRSLVQIHSSKIKQRLVTEETRSSSCKQPKGFAIWKSSHFEPAGKDSPNNKQHWNCWATSYKSEFGYVLLLLLMMGSFSGVVLSTWFYFFKTIHLILSGRQNKNIVHTVSKDLYVISLHFSFVHQTNSFLLYIHTSKHTNRPFGKSSRLRDIKLNIINTH